jgi:type II secretory pathway predicted ATPase ExeA
MENRYERYGLLGNPFRDLSSNQNVEILHVPQKSDALIEELKDEALGKENQIIIAILGDTGVGKTEKLAFLKEAGKKKKIFCVHTKADAETQDILTDILESALKNYDQSVWGKINAPAWYRTSTKLLKQIKKRLDTDFEGTGESIAKILNVNVPSFLLLDDIDSVSDEKSFLRFFSHLLDIIIPGVLIVFTITKHSNMSIFKNSSMLEKKITRKITLSPLSNEEARLLIAKRLLTKRIVDDLDVFYPFKQEAIDYLNAKARGIPLCLLKLACSTLEKAQEKRVIQIDRNMVGEVIRGDKNLKLDEIFESIPKRQTGMDAFIESHGDNREIKRNKHGEIGQCQKITPEITSYTSWDTQEIKKNNEIVTDRYPLGDARGNKENKTGFSLETVNEIRVYKGLCIQCPECGSTIEIPESMDEVKCPRCPFEGILTEV